MRENRLRAMLDAGEPTLGTRIHSVWVRAEVATPSQVEYYRELGVRHFALGVEIAVLREWWRDNGTAVRELVSAE